MGRRRAPRQLELEFRIWGGARAGSGRKRIAGRPCVPHRQRPPHERQFPVHVTLRLRPVLPTLRRTAAHRALLEALIAASVDGGFQVVHYSAMSHHVHLLCEATGEEELARGLSGMIIRIARALNRAWSRRGRVFDDRYHARRLENPRATRNALRYVLGNACRHGLLRRGEADSYCSASFVGASPPVRRLPRAWTWLLSSAEAEIERESRPA